MRLLSQPLYRYEDTKGDLIDGGLFVFVHGGAHRDPPADRGPTDAGWRPRVALRRDPDARHRSEAVSPWEFDLEGPRDPLVANHRPPGTVLGLPCRDGRSAVIGNGTKKGGGQRSLWGEDRVGFGEDRPGRDPPGGSPAKPASTPATHGPSPMAGVDARRASPQKWRRDAARTPAYHPVSLLQTPSVRRSARCRCDCCRLLRSASIPTGEPIPRG